MEGGLVVRGRTRGRQQRGARLRLEMSSSRAQRRARVRLLVEAILNLSPRKDELPQHRV